MAKKQQSPAMHLILFAHAQVNSRDRSGDQYRRAMQDIVAFVVSHGIRFEVDDFAALNHYEYYQGMHCSLIEGSPEGLYAIACGEVRGCENMSAAQSIEKWKSRRPFLIRETPEVATATRVYVGRWFEWCGERVKCTSFDDQAGTLTACTYKPHEHDENGYRVGPEKIAKRYTINHDDIRDYHAALKRWPAVMARAREAIEQGRLTDKACNDYGRAKFGDRFRQYGMRLKDIEQFEAWLSLLDEVA